MLCGVCDLISETRLFWVSGACNVSDLEIQEHYDEFFEEVFTELEDKVCSARGVASFHLFRSSVGGDTDGDFRTSALKPRFQSRNLKRRLDFHTVWRRLETHALFSIWTKMSCGPVLMRVWIRSENFQPCKCGRTRDWTSRFRALHVVLTTIKCGCWW